MLDASVIKKKMDASSNQEDTETTLISDICYCVYNKCDPYLVREMFVSRKNYT